MYKCCIRSKQSSMEFVITKRRTKIQGTRIVAHQMDEEILINYIVLLRLYQTTHVKCGQTTQYFAYYKTGHVMGHWHSLWVNLWVMSLIKWWTRQTACIWVVHFLSEDARSWFIHARNYCFPNLSMIHTLQKSNDWIKYLHYGHVWMLIICIVILVY